MTVPRCSLRCLTSWTQALKSPKSFKQRFNDEKERRDAQKRVDEIEKFSARVDFPERGGL